MIGKLQCRPGITGAATLAFAREERFLARLPKRDLDACYHDRVLPAKHRLDAEYMARASFFSDFRLILNTVLRRWDTSLMEEIMREAVPVNVPKKVQTAAATHTHISVIPADPDMAAEQQFTEA
jgi:Bacterial sugar transferase